MRRYGIVFAAALAGALLVSVLLRMPRPSVAPVSAPEPVLRAVLSVGIYPGRVIADPDTVSVGREVEITITNHRDRAVRIQLSGYEDRVDTGPIGPDGTWTGRFHADRPGERFAWLVNGRPEGRLDVRGSHLVEGHR